MSVTEKLLRLYHVDRQIRGLRSRVDAAERRLSHQDAALQKIDTQLQALSGQARQLQATVQNNENEISALDERIGSLREQLNSAKTNKQYTAILTEMNTVKADKSQVEDRALESLTRLDEVKAQIEELTQARQEAEKIRAVAQGERDQTAAEIRDRLEELERERAEAAADAPAGALAEYETEVEHREDDVMAPIVELNRKSMEFACGACQTLLPMESVNTALGRGDLTRCVSCGAILYIEPELREAVTPASKR